MKKTLSIIFALAMFLSVVSFAAPSLVGTVGTAEETDSFTSPVVDTAEVLADDYSTEVLHLTFDNDGTAFDLSLDNYGTVNFPAGFPVVSGTKFECTYPTKEIKNGTLVVSANSSWPRFIIRSGSQSFPKGKYSVAVTVTSSCAESRDISYSYGNTGFGSRYISANSTATLSLAYVYDGKKIYNYETLASVPTTVYKEIDVYTSTSNRQTDFVFDDIKMYYTPMMTVTFDAKGIGTQGNTTVEIIKGESIDLSNYVLAGDEQHIFKGWTDANGNDVTGLVKITDNTTFNAKYQDNFGTLVYDINFDGADGKALGLTIDNYGTVNHPENFPALSTAKLTNSWQNVEIKDGKVVVSSESGYPRLSVITSGSFPHGRYTLMVDFTNKNDVSRSLSLSHDNLGLWYSVSLAANETKTVPLNFTFDGEEIFVFESNKGFPLTRLYNLSMYWDAGTKGLNSFEYDNIRLYYKPLVKVNFVNNRTDETFNTLKLGYGTSVNLDSYVPQNTSEAVFTGWTDENGNYVFGNVAIEENRTFTAQWQELFNDNYGRLIYNLNFNTNETSTGCSLNNYGFINTPAGFPDITKSKLIHGFDNVNLANGKATVTDETPGWPVLEMDFGGKLPYGKYTISYNIKNISTATNLSHNTSARAEGSNKQVGLFDAIAVAPGKTVDFVNTLTYMNDNIYYYAWKADQVVAYPSLSRLAVMINTKEASSFEIDNFNIYYKAPITVSFADPAGYAAELPAAVTAFDGETYAGLDEIVCTSNDSTKVFKGWATSANGEVIGNETSVLTSATTLYAVWEDKYVPTSYNLSSIRTDAYTGIRFMASVTSEQKEEVAEYGFIVTLKKLLGDKVLTHDTDVTYVQGINYGVVDSKEIDKIYEIKDDNIFFTAVVYGFPKTADAYTSAFVVRPFTKLNGVYYYGDAVERSVCQVAENLRDKNYADMTADAIETVKGILTECGKATEPQA